jgi:hypothetical protein
MHFHLWRTVGEEWHLAGNPNFEELWILQECQHCPKKHKYLSWGIRPTKRAATVLKVKIKTFF